MVHQKNEAQDAHKAQIPRTWLTFAGLSTLLLSTAVFAGATPITSYGTGILDAGNGSVVVSGNGTTGGCINWYNGGSPPNVCPTTGGGSLTVLGGSTAPFTVGDTGTIDNLNFNTTLPLVDFISISNPGGPTPLDFDLKDIRFNTGAAIGSCTGAAALMQDVSCTPADSPFTITNGPDDPNNGNMVDTVSISFTTDDYGYTGTSGTNYNAANLYVGTFTTQQAISDATISSILTTIANGGYVNASWSATFTPQAITTTPEPASLILFGAGLAGIGLLKRKTRKV